MHRLTNQVRSYAWGSPTALPALLGTPATGRPQAELWLGAHPTAPSMLRRTGEETRLDAAIAAEPERLLGTRTVQRFGARLPYLLKVLAADAPLSLQVHPGAAQARAGHDREESASIPAGAPERSYPDPHAKPELLVAIEPFVALCGFRAPAAIVADLRLLDHPLAHRLVTDLGTGPPRQALRAALSRVLALDSKECARVLKSLVACLAHRAGSPAATTVVELARRYPADGGVLAAILLDRVELQPGEALYIPPGQLHAYLRGTALEVMGSSDNVLRAGLTEKHIDIAEVLATVRFDALPVPGVRPDSRGGIRHYRAGTGEFALSLREPDATPLHLAGDVPRIVLALAGTARLRATSGARLSLARGESAFLPASAGPVTAWGSARLVAVAPA